MKLKELFENEGQHPGFLTNPKEIKQWLDDCYIKNYTILPDGKVDVEGSVDITYINMKYIPIQFNKVTGFFHCSGNYLSSLVGSPSHVGGNFSCYDNSLESLVGCPSYVGGEFDCQINRSLESLVGCPSFIGGNVVCYRTNITSLHGLPRNINGSINISNNPNLTSLKGGPKRVMRNVWCYYNPKLESLDYAPLYVGGDFVCDERFTQEDIPFTDLKGEFKHEDR